MELLEEYGALCEELNLAMEESIETGVNTAIVADLFSQVLEVGACQSSVIELANYGVDLTSEDMPLAFFTAEPSTIGYEEVVLAGEASVGKILASPFKLIWMVIKKIGAFIAKIFNWITGRSKKVDATAVAEAAEVIKKAPNPGIILRHLPESDQKSLIKHTENAARILHALPPIAGAVYGIKGNVKAINDDIEIQVVGLDAHMKATDKIVEDKSGKFIDMAIQDTRDAIKSLTGHIKCKAKVEAKGEVSAVTTEVNAWADEIKQLSTKTLASQDKVTKLDDLKILLTQLGEELSKDVDTIVKDSKDNDKVLKAMDTLVKTADKGASATSMMKVSATDKVLNKKIVEFNALVQILSKVLATLSTALAVYVNATTTLLASKDHQAIKDLILIAVSNQKDNKTFTVVNLETGKAEEDESDKKDGDSDDKKGEE